jgi:hypothetical protein
LQLYRAGAASPPLRFGLHDYTVLIDVADEKGATVACAAMPLSLIEIDRWGYAFVRASTNPLPDGGAAAASFLTRLSRRKTDTRELRLRMLLRRRVDGAVAVLTNAQKACRFEDQEDANDPHYNDYVGFAEHGIWERGEDPNTRIGAVTWHSGADAVAPVSRLFERPIVIPYNNKSAMPARWTWRVQFPAAPGAAIQLTRMALRIGLRVEINDIPEVRQFVDAHVTEAALLRMLERRDAETDALWTTFSAKAGPAQPTSGLLKQ